MSIKVENDVFYLNGKDISYVIRVDEQGFLLHEYFGKKISSCNFSDEVIFRNWSPRNGDVSLDEQKQEYPAYGYSDLRSPAFQVEVNNCPISDLRFKDFKIIDSKPSLQGLPSAFDTNENVQTLEITMQDTVINLEVILSYSVFEDKNVLCRNTKLINQSEEDIKLLNALSANVDFQNDDYEAIYFSGAWARERHLVKTPLNQGKLEISNARGGSGHQINPFVILSKKDTTEQRGDAYGFSLVYSGNHYTAIEVDQYNLLRVQMGINPLTFQLNLKPKEVFQTPECILAYTSEGFGNLSREYHNFYKNNLIRSKYKNKIRPILINNWEATYFDFNEDKLLSIAEIAQKSGVELFVIDDGWFGKRDTDKCSLGDWYVNKNKLPNGIEGIANKLKNIGMRLGLWFEPEMISPDSDLYRAHPDWAIQVKDRIPAITRSQYVLDLTKKEVCDYIVKKVCDVLKSADISYVKWDMNRHITDMPSSDFNHKYILGLYSVLERITSEFPDVLFESCSGGGGRFDAGMLYYMPQIWTSDDSDAMERLKIQYGTSFCYPLCAMGAHVTAIPNHQTNRVTSLKTRGDIAKFGVFGYELDITKLSEEELIEIKNQISEYKKNAKLILNGDFYRLKSPFESNISGWQVVSEDKRETILLVAKVLETPNPFQTVIKLEGLEKDLTYKDCETDVKYYGDELMYKGIIVNFEKGDFKTTIKHFTHEI